MASPHRGVRGPGTSLTLQNDAAVQLGGASLASAARADTDAGGGALDCAAQADFLVYEEPGHPDAAPRRILF